MVAGLTAGLGGCVGPTGSEEPSEESAADPYGLYDVLDHEDASSIVVPLDTWGFSDSLSEQSLADLADGTVTEEEYQASFERYRGCLRDAGYELQNIFMNGPFVFYEAPAAAVESGVDDECYFAEYFATWRVWTNINHEANERQGRIHECVGKHGIDTSTESGWAMSDAEMEQLLIEAGVDPEDC